MVTSAFLTYPSIKIYRDADATTGTLSSRRLDLFSVVDGPTGVEYTEGYFPCWIVSLGIVVGLIGGAWALFPQGKLPERD